MPFDVQSPAESIVAEYNILLLGESGSGKSLFINSLAKYIYHHELSDDLMTESPRCLIPTTIVVTDQNYEGAEIHFGTANNSNANGQSVSTSCRTFIFNFGAFVLRLIDTPGFGRSDTISDDEALECILKSVSQCDFMVNGVAIVAKSNQLKFNRHLKDFAGILLGQVDNVSFLLSHSGITQYRPGDVMRAMEELLSKVPNIKPSKDNMFCFDNKGFEYMLMKQNAIEQDIEFKNSCHDAWERSAEECYRLIRHLINSQSRNYLTSSWVQHQLDLKEADKLRDLCNSFMAQNLNTFTDNQKDLIGLINMRDNSKYARIPTTSHGHRDNMAQYVCTSKKCSDLQKTPNNLYTVTYPQICGPGTKLSMMSVLSLTSYCNDCGCKVEKHKKITDSVSKREESRKTNDIDISQDQLNNVNQRINEIESEQREWKKIQEIINKLDNNPDFRVISTDRKNTLEQVTSDDGGSSTKDNDQRPDCATMATITHLKQQLFNLKIYKPYLHNQFEKSTKTVESIADPYDVKVDITRLENRLQQLIQSSNNVKHGPLDQENPLTDSQETNISPTFKPTE